MNGRTVFLLDADPELGRGLGDGSLEQARLEVLGHGLAVGRGRKLNALLTERRCGWGLLVLSGVIVHTVSVDGHGHPELLGAGDLVRPWVGVEAGPLPAEVTWGALTASRLALLDERFGLCVARYPQIADELMERLVRRSRRMSLQLSLSGIVPVEERLWLTLWHLADRWGRMGPDGAVLELPLTHRLLAEMLGTRRTTVTLAFSALAEDGRVDARGRGSWLLCGRPPGGAPDSRSGRPEPITVG